jgi:GAF domain-containing protein
MQKQTDFARLYDEGAKAIAAGTDVMDSATRLCGFLHENEKRYSWVGMYWLESFVQPGGANDALVLGTYFGPETEHTRIAFGKGVCGTAAAWALPIVVPDVRAIENYLCCNLAVRSEIVVNIFAPEFIGQLDIDSPYLDAFSADDIRLALNFARLLSQKALSSVNPRLAGAMHQTVRFPS